MGSELGQTVAMLRPRRLAPSAALLGAQCSVQANRLYRALKEHCNHVNMLNSEWSLQARQGAHAIPDYGSCLKRFPNPNRDSPLARRLHIALLNSLLHVGTWHCPLPDYAFPGPDVL